jgi:hypothetical protein
VAHEITRTFETQTTIEEERSDRQVYKIGPGDTLNLYQLVYAFEGSLVHTGILATEPRDDVEVELGFGVEEKILGLSELLDVLQSIRPGRDNKQEWAAIRTTIVAARDKSYEEAFRTPGRGPFPDITAAGQQARMGGRARNLPRDPRGVGHDQQAHAAAQAAQPLPDHKARAGQQEGVGRTSVVCRARSCRNCGRCSDGCAPVPGSIGRVGPCCFDPEFAEASVIAKLGVTAFAGSM